jgi:hypothetical protein
MAKGHPDAKNALSCPFLVEVARPRAKQIIEGYHSDDRPVPTPSENRKACEARVRHSIHYDPKRLILKGCARVALCNVGKLNVRRRRRHFFE